MMDKFLAGRQANMGNILKEQNLDIFVSSHQPYINYFTDAIDVPGIVFVSRKKIWFFTDNRFCIEVKKLSKTVDACIMDKSTWLFLEDRKFLHGKRLGLDYTVGTLKEVEYIKTYIKPVKIDDLSKLSGSLLNHHDAESIKRTKKAISIAKRAFYSILDLLKPGVTEIEIACEISTRMKKNGGDGDAFPPIVAFGPNAAKPHAVPTERKLKKNDLVLIDMGSCFKGLSSDFTRTIILGEGNYKISEHANLLKKLSRDAGKKLRSGARVSEFDIAVRDSLRTAGIEKYYTHALGHGVGYVIHAQPRIARNSNEILCEGMIVTVEPGVYFEGEYGIRHEDMYLITKNESINLTKF